MGPNLSTSRRRPGALAALAAAAFAAIACGMMAASAADAPSPLLDKDTKVDWWFAYKFNVTSFRGCDGDNVKRTCPFGGKVQTKFGSNFSQQYAFASSGANAGAGALKHGKGCIGTTLTDPLGATFDQIYNGSWFFVIWNDQFYGDPKLKACGAKGNCDRPWGHSKGMLAWNDAGEGIVLQVTTPSWPAAGSFKHVRKAGNTLGCVSTQNNLNNAQHFFSLKLDRPGVVAVLTALKNASVVTDPKNAQIARIGGPADIQALAEELGQRPATDAASKKETNKVYTKQLTDEVMLISKPSNLNVPPWQMVSAVLESGPARTATWWASPQIYSTLKSTKINCWDDDLKADKKKSAAVAIAKTGTWEGKSIGLIGGQNHAKIGVTTAGGKQYAIFGDLNQQGTINPPHCDRSQNGRGGLFFAVANKDLYHTVSDLMDGETEPVKAK